MAKEIIATGNTGFEDQLWNAASILWGTMAPSNYQNVTLGLVFLKYISDRFDERYKELVEEGAGFEEDRDEYVAEGYFFVPEKARWSYILQYASRPEIGKVIDEAMVAIESDYPSLKGVLPKNYSDPMYDKTKLGEVVVEFSNILMNQGETDRDVLGRTYEFFLTKFSKNAGKGGEFFTPPCIVNILVNVIQPFKGVVYDPCCGSGGMFVQSAKFIKEHSGNLTKDVTIYGQDANPETWKLCKMNLAIRGIEADLGASNADTFHNDQHPALKADFILANPPFNLDHWGADKLKDDPRWKYGIPSDSNANYAWIEHMTYTENSKAVEEELSYCGYFCIVTSEKMTAKEALAIYKSRDENEKLFRADKSFLGNGSMRVHSEESTESKILIEFAALIIRCKFFTCLKDTFNSSASKPNYATVPAAIRELEKIEMARNYDGIYRLDHAVTRRQKDILKCFGLDADQVKEISRIISKQLSATEAR